MEVVQHDKAIWTPNSGMVPAGWHDALRTVREYDDSLTLGRRPDGEWVVCKKRSDGGYPFPVLSLGFSAEAPGREAILERMVTHDVRRNGARIVDAVERANAKKREDARKAASEAADEWLEYAEYQTRGVRG